MKYRLIISVAGCVAVLSGWALKSKTAPAASTDCNDFASYTNSFEVLGSCRGPVGISAEASDSASAFMTCLDKGLKAVLVKDLADAIETGDKRKIQAADLSLETFKSYCEEVETELAKVHDTIDDHVEAQVVRLADTIWTRHWQPQFIDYIVDPTGYTRGLFSQDAWELMRSDILTNHESQWFFDQKASFTVFVREQALTSLEDNRWEVDAKIVLKVRLEDAEKGLELELDEHYVIGAHANYVSDTNLAGLFMLETDTDLKPVFDKIYETFPVEPENPEGSASVTGSEN